MEKFYQACFSRLGKNDISAGWQLLNASADMPMPLKEMYTKSQVGNQPEGYETPKDIHGKDLCMLEIISNGTEIGISRVQYGLSDSFGRENMFCHGYLFQNAYDLLKDPNRLLGVSDGNFRFTEEATEVIPTALVYDAPMSVESALKLCGMDKKAYVEYILCLYYILGSGSKSVIYVQTDGTDSMAKALLYLAYCAVPYSMRPKITAATYGGTQSKSASIVLCAERPENGLYLNPVTGENNVLNTNIRNRWARYPFVDYFARNFDQPGKDWDDYYGQIEHWLTRMGDKYLNKVDIIRLAFDMIFQNNDEDVPGLLYDWLSLPLPINETLESSVADLLNKAIERNIDLGADKEELLFSRLQETTSRELVQLGNRYQVNQLLKRPLDDAVAFLNTLVAESPTFNAMRALLSGTTGGLAIVRAYYLQKVEAQCKGRTLTYADLETLSMSFSDLPEMTAIWDIISACALAIAVENIHKGASYTKAGRELGTFFQNNYRNVNWKRCLRELANAYDYEFRQNFNPIRLEEYAGFYHNLDMNDIEQFLYSRELVKQYQAIAQRNWVSAANFAVAGCPLNGVPMQPAKARTMAIETIMSFALYKQAAQQCTQIAFWHAMALALNRNPVELMIKHEASLFCNAVTLAQSIAEDPFWTDEKLEWMCMQYRAYVEETADNTYKKSLEAMTREQKLRAEEMKRMLKEQKRQERQERQESQDRGGIFGKFLSRDASKTEEEKGMPWDDTAADDSDEPRRSSWKRNADDISYADAPDARRRKDEAQEERGSGLNKLWSGFGGFGKKNK